MPTRPDPGSDLAGYLAGAWRVERDVRDGERHGRFEGVATFTQEPGGELRWDETGELRLGPYRGPARRQLRLVPDGDAWEVRFEDGRPFHRLDLRAGRWTAGHDCRADRYDGVFSIAGDDAFEVAWDVAGPAKDQRILSRYERR
ncbi:MAG TPA: DUF6314 family protein [Capillimicrobium sp.]